MISSGIDPQLMAKQADTKDLIRFKQEMDGLKGRLAGAGADKAKQLRKACENFEAVFISKLWKEMKSTVPKEGYLHSKQEDMYMSMFDREFAEKMSQAGGIGLADMIYEQLSEKLKETSRNALTGGVQIKPLAEQPIALNDKKGAIPLSGTEKSMTLEDWGGAAAPGPQSSAGVSSETIVSGIIGETPQQPRMNDVDVKAKLDELTRRLETERIKAGLLGTPTPRAGRAYGQGMEETEAGQLGRKLAEIG